MRIIVWHLGGDSTVLFFNGLQSWIESIKSNPAIIQFKHLKPMYDLLDKEIRSKVIQVYERVVANENFIYYNCPLTFAPDVPLPTDQSGPYLRQIQHLETKSNRVSPDTTEGTVAFVDVSWHPTSFRSDTLLHGL